MSRPCCVECGSESTFYVSKTPMAYTEQVPVAMCTECYSKFSKSKDYILTLVCPSCEVIFGLPPTIEDWTYTDSWTEREKKEYDSWVRYNFGFSGYGTLLRMSFMDRLSIAVRLIFARKKKHDT